MSIPQSPNALTGFQEISILLIINELETKIAYIIHPKTIRLDGIGVLGKTTAMTEFNVLYL
jgi:hypothetical protein